ncbi:MAG: multiheme c-type cytochrome, partial [Rhodanobacteraceae bacterium]
MPDQLLLPGNVQPPPPKPAAAGGEANAAAAHAQMLIENKFPSATTCATCHPTQFRQWSVSQHAYAQLSPVFNAFQATVDRMTAGTNGDFCIRCHTQVGMQISEPVFGSNMDRNSTSREGITCISCHRVKNNYGKVSGRIALQQGDIFDPVYGPRGNANLKKVLSQPDKFQVVTKRGEVGRAIHTKVIKYDPLEKSGFCGDCHDVNLLNGFRLEEAFTQFKN